MVEETVVVRAPARVVWNAIADGDARRRWWPHLELDATSGGRVEEWWTDATGREVVTRGKIVEVVPGRRLRATWADEGWPAETLVEVALAPVAGGGTAVTVRHSGFERLPDGDALAAAHRAGWKVHLENLRGQVESASS